MRVHFTTTGRLPQNNVNILMEKPAYLSLSVLPSHLYESVCTAHAQMSVCILLSREQRVIFSV